MAWEHIEQRLQKAFTVKVAFPAGTIWLPDERLSIDDWLESIAESDEELFELQIPRIRFLQNRWLTDQLVELEWDEAFANRRVILVMYVGQRAYILFSDWKDYLVVAALEPKDEPTLYQAIVDKLLENRSFVRTVPSHITNHRPDLIAEVVMAAKERRARPRPAPEFAQPVGVGESSWKQFLSDVLVGWIPKWLALPEIGFWHEETQDTLAEIDEAETQMKYNRAA
jgi:hypothetical protein